MPAAGAGAKITWLLDLVPLRVPRALSERETCKRNCIDKASFLKTRLQQTLNGHRFDGTRMNLLFAVESAVVNLLEQIYSAAATPSPNLAASSANYTTGATLQCSYLSYFGLVFGQMEQVEMCLVLISR